MTMKTMYISIFIVTFIYSLQHFLNGFIPASYMRFTKDIKRQWYVLSFIGSV